MARLGSLCCALLVFALAPVATAEDDVRTFKREQLLRVARQAVNPANPAVGGIEDIRRATQEQRAAFAAELPDVFRRLDALIGTTKEGPGGFSEGIIREAARLHRWVVGALLPEERHDLEKLEAWRKANTPKVEDAPNGSAGNGPKEGGDAKPAKDQPTVPDAPPMGSRTEHGYDIHKPMFDVLPAKGEAIRLAATPPKDLSALTDELRAALIEGELRIALATGTGPAGDVIDLDGIRSLRAATALVPGPSDWRYTLVAAEELEWAEGVDYEGWRALQVELRRSAMARERPQGLVSDAEVADREDRVQRYEARLALHERRRELVLAAFDQMSRAQKHWQEEIGQLGFDIEETKGKCENCSPEELEALKRQLVAKQLTERAVQQEQRLLYLAAIRAAARLEYIEKCITHAKSEVASAASVLRSFVEAQSKARRETQLAQLAVQADDFESERREAEKLLAAESDPTRKASYADYIQTLDAMTELNQTLARVVRLRRNLEAKSAGKTAPEIERAVAKREADGKAAAAEGGAKDGASESAVTEVDPLAAVRHPEMSDLNASYVDIVRGLLDHEAFDAALVAKHHAAVDEVIRSLQSALDATRNLDETAAAFDKRAADVDARIPEVAEVLWHRRLRRSLNQMRSAYRDTVSAIHVQVRETRTKLARLRSWRAELEDLGVRSFAIRQDRTLGAEQLGVAGDDVAATAKDAVRWFGFEGKHHLGTFVGRHWPALLTLLGILAVGVLVVRFGRRWIDARLVAMADAVPELKRAVTIRAETQEARAQARAAEAKRREAEQAALKDAAGDPELTKGAVSGSAGEAGQGE